MPSVSAPSLSYRQVMVFVDGGYLREYLKKKWDKDEFSTGAFQHIIRELIEYVRVGNICGELVRIYYYDAIVGESESEKLERQKKFFGMLRRVPFCSVRLGRLVKTEKRYRQKGVDILIAIDMLSKAYENHYEIAFLIAGDGDFVDLVEAVKDAGKRVYGAYIKTRLTTNYLIVWTNT